MANVWIQKIAGIIGAVVVTYAAQKGITLSPDETTALFVTIFTAIELWVAKKTNPGNAASEHLAAKEKREVATLKADANLKR